MDDTAILDGRKKLGAGDTNNGRLFALGSEENIYVYGDDGTLLFSAEAAGMFDAVFLPDVVVAAPMHGTPLVFCLRRGTLITELEAGYLTHINSSGKYYISQYIADGEMFGLLLDENFSKIAELKNLCDVYNEELFFDYPKGVLRKSEIVSLDDLMEMAKALP
jgi:hypothetical protein